MDSSREKIKIAVGVRTARTALGWNQQEFADRMGVAKSTVARIETLEVNARADFLTKALTLFKRAGVAVDLLDFDKVTVEVGSAALTEAQSRLEDEVMRRSDRKRPADKQSAQRGKSGDGGDAPSNPDDPRVGSW